MCQNTQLAVTKWHTYMPDSSSRLLSTLPDRCLFGPLRLPRGHSVSKCVESPAKHQFWQEAKMEFFAAGCKHSGKYAASALELFEKS